MGGSVKIAPSFHLDCRDSLSNDYESFLKLYHTHVLINKHATGSTEIINELIDAKVCFRCETVRSFITKCKVKASVNGTKLNGRNLLLRDASSGGNSAGSVSDASKMWLISNIARDYL